MGCYGIFSDEGQLEGGFYTPAEAAAAMAAGYTEEDEVRVLECCADHPEEARHGCEQCAEDEDEDEDEDDEEPEDDE